MLARRAQQRLHQAARKGLPCLPPVLLLQLHAQPLMLEEVRMACGPARNLVPTVDARRTDTQHAYAWRADAQGCGWRHNFFARRG